MSETSPNLSLPYIMAAQSQKHVTHNEAIRSLDAIVQLAVLNRTLAAPPATPAEGNAYIVAAGASGAWSGQTARIAAFQDGAWAFYVPREGWLAWVSRFADLLQMETRSTPSAPGAGWKLLARERRNTSEDEITAIYKRTGRKTGS